MEKHTPEKGPEHILTKDEILKEIARFAENAVFVREKSDELGLYLLEVKIDGKEPGEVIEYQYMRKKKYEGGNGSKETGICVTSFINEFPGFSEMITVYDEETKLWKDIKST